MHLSGTSVSTAAFTLALTAAAAAQPVITELNDSVYSRSGRVAITGSGFGTDGQVVIAGLDAWTATWNDGRVVAYVPEGAPLGTASLQVVTGGETSNAVSLTVTNRQPDGRVRWVFETDGDSQWWRPALAPDGTIYIHTNTDFDGVVYALSPDGALLWIRKVDWYPHSPPSAGPDGALYTDSINTVYRITPDGQIDWTVSGQELGGTPTIGPDGMLYGAFEVQPGAFAIDPATGQYDWTNDPQISNWGQPGNEIRFGRPGPGEPVDRFYISWDAIWAFSLDGDHLFTTGVPNVVAHEPAIGADGTIYNPGGNSAWLMAYSPDDGSILWQTDSDWLAHISSIEIAPDDTLYFISDGRRMHAYDPHSQSTLWINDTGISLGRPTLSPDTSMVITTGGGFQDQIGFAKAFDTATGAELWTLELEEFFNPNFRRVPEHRVRFSADSSVAYMPAWIAQWPFHDGDPRALLYALDTGELSGVTGDLDGDGVVAFSDVLVLIGAWGPCSGACPADLDGSGDVGFGDILVILANWS
ncbi:MAG: outer membrane protein assembly factor BamB family protein [Planctomycetota bacterium]|jgi:hypothetical protein